MGSRNWGSPFEREEMRIPRRMVRGISDRLEKETNKFTNRQIRRRLQERQRLVSIKRAQPQWQAVVAHFNSRPQKTEAGRSELHN